MGEALQLLLSILEKEGVQALLEESTAKHIPGAVGYDLNTLGQKADLIIIIGGDGTTLGIARRMACYHLPMIAINAGRLGFITDFSLKDMHKTLPPLLHGEYSADTRGMLEAKVLRRGKCVFTATAVNDAGITHGRAGSMVEFNVSVDGSPMATQRADGVIVATATGSTAYALAAGGPILHPSLNAMVLVPVAPHTLTNRPIVLPGNCTVEISLIAAKEAAVKALGTGFCGGITPKSVWIENDGLGAPIARFDSAFQSKMDALGAKKLCVSITHLKDYAQAIAIISR